MSNESLEKKVLIPETFSADPSANVFNGKIYIYPSHDRDIVLEHNDNGDEYMMEDYHVYEMEDVNTMPRDCGMALHIKDIPWASIQAWAPDCAEKNGTYYFYFPARDKQGMFRLGVATAKNPAGPFKAEPEPIKGSYSIDPCIFPDDDGQYYLTWGGIWGGQLDQYRNNVWGKDNKEPVGDELAVCGKIAKMSDDMLQFAEEPRDIVVLDENGKPLTGKDHDKRYFEGPWLFKRNGKYYFTYSTGDTHLLIWTISDNVYGPYTYGGVIMTPPVGWTTHHSICEFKGKWYLFYHDCIRSNGVNHHRDVKFQEIKFRDDGSIITVNP